jgi:glycosyltransferase involved in cell wall biosynthesis
VPAGKLFVAPNALDTELIAHVKQSLTVAQLEGFHERQGVTRKKFVIFCGRLVERKQPDVLLRALALVVQVIPQVHALIVGDGPRAGELKRLCDTLSLNHTVSFLGPIFDETILARCFMSSQALVVPAAAGLNIQHAFGYGIPVIAGNDLTGHGPEIALVQHGITGLFCRSADPASFAAAIERLLSDKDLQRQLGSNALKLVNENFTLAAMAKGFWDGVEHCLSSTSSFRCRPQTT